MAFFLARKIQFRDTVWKFGIKALAVELLLTAIKVFCRAKFSPTLPLIHLFANFVSFFFFFFLFFSLPEESRRNFKNGGSTPRVSVTFTHDDIISRVRDSRPPLSQPRYRDVARIFISRSFREIFLFLNLSCLIII